VPNNEIKQFFRKVRTDTIPSSEERMVIIMKFIGNSFHYAHQHKKLLTTIKEHNKKFPKDRIDEGKIKKLCEEKAAGDAKDSEELRESYQPYDHLFDDEVVKK
jgi:hypothetical protein